jgi:hypothetical protein
MEAKRISRRRFLEIAAAGFVGGLVGAVAGDNLKPVVTRAAEAVQPLFSRMDDGLSVKVVHEDGEVTSVVIEPGVCQRLGGGEAPMILMKDVGDT